ncbi:MAG: pyridoxamine 5'-phosphate oxidase family protein [Pseudomonadota bacterium]
MATEDLPTSRPTTRLGGWPDDSSPFHAGEQAVQSRLGVRDRSETLGRRMIRPSMPDQHRAFYESQPLIFAGHLDSAGTPWASVLSGEPGFITTPDARTLRIAAHPAPGDPLGEPLVEGTPIGLLGIEFATRRRNRVNGRIASTHPSGFRMAVDQAFGNCPQYIHPRAPRFQDHRAAGAVEMLSGLDTEARATIAAADTFFVASHSGGAGSETGAAGADVSHRGGPPGFVQLEGDTLTIPDYRGNNAFNTLGNFALVPRAGLLFLDFERGDALMLTGRVDILWDGPEVAAMPGAQRAWRVTVEAGRRLRSALPLRGARPAA